jgi:photosystem II stability/assembly factor-like uncharacterized protein
VSHNLKAWLHAVAFADQTRGYIVGEKGIILRTDDGGLTWKDQENSAKTNLFAISIASRDDVLIAGDQGRVLGTKDGGLTWVIQPSITSSPLFAVAYRGGSNAWVAGRGGAILRRTESLATFRNPGPKGQPSLGGNNAPKLKGQENSQQLNLTDDGDIPPAVRPAKKPAKP